MFVKDWSGVLLFTAGDIRMFSFFAAPYARVPSHSESHTLNRIWVTGTFTPTNNETRNPRLSRSPSKTCIIFRAKISTKTVHPTGQIAAPTYVNVKTPFKLSVSKVLCCANSSIINFSFPKSNYFIFQTYYV